MMTNKSGRLVVVVFLSLLLVHVHAQGTRSRASYRSSDAPVKTASKNSPLDPSNFVVVLLAAMILIYGSYRALRPPFVDMGGTSGEGSAYEELNDAGESRIPNARVCSHGLGSEGVSVGVTTGGDRLSQEK